MNLSNETNGRFFPINLSLRACLELLPKGLVGFPSDVGTSISHRGRTILSLVQEEEFRLYFMEQGKEDTIPLINIYLKRLMIPFIVQKVEKIWYLKNMN